MRPAPTPEEGVTEPPTQYTCDLTQTLGDFWKGQIYQETWGIGLVIGFVIALALLGLCCCVRHLCPRWTQGRLTLKVGWAAIIVCSFLPSLLSYSHPHGLGPECSNKFLEAYTPVQNLSWCWSLTPHPQSNTYGLKVLLHFTAKTTTSLPPYILGLLNLSLLKFTPRP